MATFTGSNSAEILPDLIIGPVQGIGNDFVDALGGDDVAIGWSGDDVIRGGAGADVIIGGLLNAAGIITLSGVDAADYTTSVDGVSVDLSVLISLTLPILGINIQLTGASQGFGGDAQGDYLVGIVNLIGSNTGGDTLTGSAAANTMNGQGGNDRLDGQGGNDILLGGAADDVLIGGGGADSLQGGAGTNDTADYSGSASAVSVNLLTGTGTGGDAQGDTLTGIENLIGSASNDTLIGSAANNILDGGAGGDVLNGSDGVDRVTYVRSSAGVTVSLVTGTGTGGDAEGDTLTSIENLTGSDFADTLTGDGGVNSLTGGNGNDALEGGGGADALDGSDGTDRATYIQSSAGVLVDLVFGNGIGGDAQGDTLTGIEDLTGSNFDDVLTGNAGVNSLSGSIGNDILDGGAGDDVLDGGAGTDLMRVDSAADQVIEAVGDGTDTVVSTVSYTLAAAAEVEFLQTSDATGTTAINLRGNAFQQTIEGNAGNNTLHDGGTGPLKNDGVPDTLIGHGGDDTYVVYDAEAVIIEIAGEGQDKLASGANFVLGNDISIEYLCTSSQIATYAIDLTGNNLGQWVRGSNGVNVLDGGGGIDTLWGMGGADSFRFSTALGADNVDKIADFSVVDDTIQLDDAIFTALGVGPLDPSAFKDIGVAGQDADDRILYNSKNGSLFYDADGSGSGSTPIKFAMLSPGLGLTAADFVVI